MNDIDDKVIRMLHEKASEVPPHVEVPSSLARRVRPRIARNVVLVAASVAAVTLVAFAGLRSLHEPEDRSLNTGPSVAGEPDTCSIQDLVTTPSLEGAAGSREGAIAFRNSSGGACTLRGWPQVELFASDGSVADADVTHGPPAWKVDASPAPPGWPLVTLEPGRNGSVRFGWSNWCGDPAPTLRLKADDGTVVAEVHVNAVDVPPCNAGPGSKATLEIGPFEPAA
jgi:Domain of unknown function (DUF4232)